MTLPFLEAQQVSLKGRVGPVSFAAPRGAAIALVGPNGGGKSTLLRLIAGRLRPTSGRIQTASRSIAFMPQRAAIDASLPLTARSLVELGLWPRLGLFGAVRPADRARIDAALAAASMTAKAESPLRALSGGELQRALFAKALAEDADLILLDEPFTGVDARSEQVLYEALAQWRARGRTIVAALHDHDGARRHFDFCLLLAGEALAFGPPDAVLTPESMHRAQETLASKPAAAL